ncbi:5'-nucleotidase [Myxococcaceae bacterium JPH2]|nr:5'-nucleotidase [Myxococcaceae bacterium JPH2]
MLVLDAGNALFKSTDIREDPTARARAELLLQQMEAQGYAAMAVGARDLMLGVDFLKTRTKGTKLKLLSANLTDAKGQLLFPASQVVTAGGLKVGVVGVSPPTGPALPPAPPVRGLPVLPAVSAEARRLRKEEHVDLVVVLAAVPYDATVRLAQDVEGVDFVVQSHEGRGEGMAQRQGLATLIPPGERGRQVAKLELSIDGPGPFVDLSESTRARESQRMVENNIARVKARLGTEKDAAQREMLTQTLTSFEERRESLRKLADAASAGKSRTHLLSYLQLTESVAADPAVQQRVERIEPPGSAAH